MRGIVPIVVIILIVIVAIATGVGVLETATGPTTYSCMTISHQGNQLTLKTSGLVHYVKAQYYVTCNEGSTLPTNTLTTSCLTITPQYVPSSIGVGVGTNYFYLSTTSGHAIALQGAPAPTNGTEITTPAAISLSVSC